MTNLDLSLCVFSFLEQVGLNTLVVCAGARNAPLVLALENQNFKVFNYFEERSAAFFGMGLIKAYKKPVAILTTSGTAVAELLPAVIEANYQGLPLMVITADRPKNYRGTGSPQTIDQVGLFSTYVERVYDLDVATEKFHFIWTQKKPLHLNVAFDEPLIDQQSLYEPQVIVEKQVLHERSLFSENSVYDSGENSSYDNNNNSRSRPLIILGEIPEQKRAAVIEFIIKNRAPVYAESLSQIKNYPELKSLVIRSSDILVKHIFRLKICNTIIRIGGVPTLRFWRDLEYEFKDIPVMNYIDLPFTGLARESTMAELEALDLISVTLTPSDSYLQKMEQIKRLDEELQAAKQALFKKFPLSEQSLTWRLSLVVNKNPLYLGNSLPIRNWDQFAECNSISLFANRGANGIDGQVSTYLGWSESLEKSYCYIGDLTAFYDLAALGLNTQLSSNQRFIMVMNNFGGQIFKRVFKNDKFINSHSTQFYHWAKMWNWNYLKILVPDELEKIDRLTGTFNIIEILPNAEQTQLFWDEWDNLCQKL